VADLVLLPTARLVPTELQTEFGPIPSCMIPIDSRPALHYILERYVENGYESLVAIHDRPERVIDYLERHPGLRARTVDVGPTRCLGETVLVALRSLATLPESLVINFADTFVGDDLVGDDVVVCADVADAFRWTTFKTDSAERITSIRDKDQAKSPAASYRTFVGVFKIADARRFGEVIAERLDSDSPLDPFYEAVRAYYNGVDPDGRRFQRAADWRDFGHLDTYTKTKQAFFLNRRWFNDVQIDAERGIVRKSSSEADKLIDEIRWYQQLPDSLQHIAPRIFRYETADRPSVEMEFYGYPALNDVYLFGECDRGIWERILDALGRFLAELGRHRLEPRAPDTLVNAMRQMYEKKTRARLESVRDVECLRPFWTERLTINGRACLGLDAALELLPRIAGELDLYSVDHFTVIHGDLCLSNVLWDRRTGIVRVVDPRGSFGGFDIHGDPRYDLAKLSHSFEGHYDFFVNDLYDLEWSADGLSCSPHLSAGHRHLRVLIEAWLDRICGGRRHQVRYIESLLFLSMVPLHSDRAKAQQAFLARGLELLTQVAEGCGLGVAAA
jgi:hypothetical protein